MTMTVKQIGALAVAVGAAATLASGASVAQITTQDLTIQANVADTCVLDSALGGAWTLDFGTYLPQDEAAADTDFEFTVQCAAGTSYHVTMGAGLQPQANGLRRMITAGGDSANTRLNYRLYFAPEFSAGNEWNEEQFPAPRTSDGAADSYTVYGRIPAGQQKIAGEYEDTVLVSVILQ